MIYRCLNHSKQVVITDENMAVGDLVGPQDDDQIEGITLHFYRIGKLLCIEYTSTRYIFLFCQSQCLFLVGCVRKGLYTPPGELIDFSLTLNGNRSTCFLFEDAIFTLKQLMFIYRERLYI